MRIARLRDHYPEKAALVDVKSELCQWKEKAMQLQAQLLSQSREPSRNQEVREGQAWKEELEARCGGLQKELAEVRKESELERYKSSGQREVKVGSP